MLVLLILVGIIGGFFPLGDGRLVTVRKCCPSNQVIDVNAMKCRDSGDKTWSPRYYPDEENPNEDEELSYEITKNIPRCPGTGVHVLPLRELSHLSEVAAKFRLLKSGRLVAKHASGNWIDVPENSCIDGIMNFRDGDEPNSYTGEEIDQAIITCPVSDTN